MDALGFLSHVTVHLALCSTALFFALAVGIPLGILSAHVPWARPPVIVLTSLGRVVPSLAVLTLMLPLLGLGARPAVVALTVLALPPIVINTDAGFRSIAQPIRDAARALGFGGADALTRVEWPLALPLVFAGVRTAAVEVVASATLAAFIGGGGLGEYIVNGLALNDTGSLLTGALTVAALALATDAFLARAQRRFTRYSGA